jgi:hypothetical protein
MVDEKAFIKSYDISVIIHKINGQVKYRLIEKFSTAFPASENV